MQRRQGVQDCAPSEFMTKSQGAAPRVQHAAAQAFLDTGMIEILGKAAEDFLVNPKRENGGAVQRVARAWAQVARTRESGVVHGARNRVVLGRKIFGHVEGISCGGVE